MVGVLIVSRADVANFRMHDGIFLIFDPKILMKGLHANSVSSMTLDVEEPLAWVRYILPVTSQH